MERDVQALIRNNRLWAEHVTRERPGFFRSLSVQQTPKFMWIGCSDSRVPANQITGLDPGEIFVHRNVANLVMPSDLNALAAVQFAVDVLQVEHILVVGHYGCGGVRAALEGRRVGLADNWLRNVVAVRDRHEAALARLPRAAAADALVDLNVIAQVAHLCASTVLCDAWSRGANVTVHGWSYGLSDGLLQQLGVSISKQAAARSACEEAIQRILRRHEDGDGSARAVHQVRSDPLNRRVG